MGRALIVDAAVFLSQADERLAKRATLWGKGQRMTLTWQRREPKYNTALQIQRVYMTPH